MSFESCARAAQDADRPAVETSEDSIDAVNYFEQNVSFVVSMPRRRLPLVNILDELESIIATRQESIQRVLHMLGDQSDALG